MRKIILPAGFILLLFTLAGSVNASDYTQESNKGWKAGVAGVEITPGEYLWMRGYGGRTHPADGKISSLWAKALSLEDASGQRAVLITMDVCGLPKGMSDTIRNRLNRNYDLEKSQIILSFSHTHSGPFLRDPSGYKSYRLSPAEIEKIERYSDWLEDQIVGLAAKSLQSRVPVRIFSGTGVARFAVNRRNNVESALDPLKIPSGPVDHSVPVIKITGLSGEVLAVVFGYACHSTTLGLYQWSGDYPGFAQAALEEAFPGSVAMFFAGCGSDQNPLPRRTVSYARQYGKTLAASVEAVLNEPMRELESRLVTGYIETKLPYSTLPSREELERLAKESKGTTQEWYKRLLADVNNGRSLQSGYPDYPLQIWRIGKQTLVTLGGEVVVDYSLRLKQLLGEDLIVMAYANDYDPGYIPSVRVLREGGYEGASSITGSNQSVPWRADIEMIIIQKVLDLARQSGIEIPDSKLTNK
jgi:hypothetical protein